MTTGETLHENKDQLDSAESKNTDLSKYELLLLFKQYMSDFKMAGELFNQIPFDTLQEASVSGSDFIQPWINRLRNDFGDTSLQPHIKAYGHGVLKPSVTVEMSNNDGEQRLVIVGQTEDIMHPLEPEESAQGVLNSITAVAVIDEATGSYKIVPYVTLKDSDSPQYRMNSPGLPLDIMRIDLTSRIYVAMTSESHIEFPELEQLEDQRLITDSLVKNGIVKSTFRNDLHQLIDAFHSADRTDFQPLKRIDRVRRVSDASVDYVNKGFFSEDKMSDLLKTAFGNERILKIDGCTGTISDVFFSRDDETDEVKEVYIALRVTEDDGKTALRSFALKEILELSF